VGEWEELRQPLHEAGQRADGKQRAGQEPGAARVSGYVTPVAIPTVTADQLLRKIEEGDEFVLLDALAPMVYAHSHLPRAINLPPSAVDPSIVARRIPDRDTLIIVYCANPNCEDSVATAQRLQALGYTNVHHYPGGKNEWRDAGLPLERAGKPLVAKS